MPGPPPWHRLGALRMVAWEGPGPYKQ